MGSVTRLGILDKVVDPVLGSIPEHDADGHSRVLERRGNHDIPEMEDLDTRGGKEDLNPRVVAQSPCNTKLSGTGIAG